MERAVFQKRNLWVMLLLYIVTLGFYFFYWLYKTKEEINKIGGKIPTIIFAVIPFLNIYFDYRYAQDYVKYIRKSDDKGLIILFFLLIFCLPIFAPFIIQYDLNNR